MNKYNIKKEPDKPCSNCGKFNNIVAKGLCDTCYRRSRIGPIPLIKCACSPDCKEMIPAFDIRGKPLKFAHGHNFFVQKNPRDTGGYYTDKQGHLMLKAPNHPYVDTRGYVRKNRLEYEKYMTNKEGKPFFLHPSKGIEHLDGNKNNYEISNLKVVDRGGRWRMAGSTVKSDRRDRTKPFICIECNQEKRQYSGNYCETCYRRKKQNEAGLKKCECKPDCKEMIPCIDFEGKPRRFAQGHNFYVQENPNYKGGVRIDKDGYIYILKPDHPFCDKAGYVPQHRLVMEEHLSELAGEEVYIPPEIEVHHKKPVSKEECDNSLENLQIVTHQEHGIIHKDLHVIDKSGRYCCDPECKDPQKRITDKDGHERWRKNVFEWLDGEWLHDYCFRRNKRKKDLNSSW